MTSKQEASPLSGPGSLRWGIKHSFLRYLGRLPDGQCSVTDGASAVTDGATPAPGPLFVFTAADDQSPDDQPDSPPDGLTVLRYRGDVRFKGHFGFLRVRVADPWLEIAGAEGKLSAIGIGGEPAPRQPLVTFRVRRDDDGPQEHGPQEHGPQEHGPQEDGPQEDGPQEHGPEELATVFRGTDVRLTAEGSELFGEHYPAGEPFDDFVFEMPRR